MKKQEIFNKYKSIGLSTNEATAEFDMILDYLKISPLKEIKEGFSNEEKEKISAIINERISTKRPLQQIIGFGYFMGEKFFVDENTLIPRPETEILVDECTKLINNTSSLLDIGTGTGCIAIELNKLTGAKVDAVDISKKTLNIAEKNNAFHKTHCKFFQSDLFSNVTKKYDLIVSNPPYIPLRDINRVEEHVLKFEPHAALFTNDEFGIEFYEKIINESVTFLNKNGCLAFEIGINQSELIINSLNAKGFSEPKIIKDFNNIARIIISKKNL